MKELIRQGPDAVTMEELRKISQALRKSAVPPYKVMNSAEAERMTKEDRTGRKWAVGEEYYRLEYSDGLCEFQHPGTR